MKRLGIVGLLLIVFGLFALAYQGFTYTKKEKVVDLGPVEVTREDKEHVPLGPAAGITAIIGGVALVALSQRH